MTEEWIERVRLGEPEAFEEMVHMFTPIVYKIAFSMLGNEHDAKDATQEIFIKIFRCLPQLRADGLMKAWICRIASNTCLDMLRAQSRFRGISADDENVLFEIPDTGKTPEESAITKETQETVRLAIDSLPSEYKLCLTLCDINGLSYMEAANALSCPLGTLKSRLSRARALLYKRLSEKRELFDLPLRPKNSEEAKKQ